jgi:hypothetical protein
VNAKSFKSGVMLIVVSGRIDVRFSYVSWFRFVDLFSFIV